MTILFGGEFCNLYKGKYIGSYMRDVFKWDGRIVSLILPKCDNWLLLELRMYVKLLHNQFDVSKFININLVQSKIYVMRRSHLE